MQIGSAWLLKLKLSSCSLREVRYPSSKCLLSNAESFWLTECFSLCTVYPDTHAHTLPGSCGQQHKCKRAKELREEQTDFPSFPDSHSNFTYCSFPIFFGRGLQCSLISHFWLSLAEPNQTPCLGPIFTQGFLVPGSRKKVNFQRQSCSLCIIPSPTGVDIKLFQVCRKQGMAQGTRSCRGRVSQMHRVFGSRGEAGTTSTSLLFSCTLVTPACWLERIRSEVDENCWYKSPCSLRGENKSLPPLSQTGMILRLWDWGFLHFKHQSILIALQGNSAWSIWNIADRGSSYSGTDYNFQGFLLLFTASKYFCPWLRAPHSPVSLSSPCSDQTE